MVEGGISVLEAKGKSLKESLGPMGVCRQRSRREFPVWMFAELRASLHQPGATIRVEFGGFFGELETGALTSEDVLDHRGCCLFCMPRFLKAGGKLGP